MMPQRASDIFSLLVLLAFTVTGVSCSQDEPSAPDAQKYDIEKEYQRGPATVRLKIDHKEITIADRIQLVLQAVVDEDYEVELPKFGDKLEQFGIVDYRSRPPVLADDGRVSTEKTYVLEPFLSGDYKIPPMKIAFWKRAEKEPKRHEIETEELTVQVKSLLPEKAAELKIKDIAGPVELPRPKRAWGYVTAVGAVTLLAVVAVLWAWRRHRKGGAPVAPRIPAHELAYRELERVIAENLIDSGQVKMFYVRVSDVLRHYIENRFGLHAPERTTEEFLSELQMSDTLTPEHNRLLTAFLNHCDLVKFAELQPDTGQIQKTFDACRQFIMETQSEESTVPLAPAA